MNKPKTIKLTKEEKKERKIQTQKAAEKKYREENRDKYNKYQKEYRKKNREKLNEKRRNWIKSRYKSYGCKHAKDNKEKYAAYSRLHQALKSGKIKKNACPICGNPDVVAFYNDYSDIKTVEWLCRYHHREKTDKRKNKLDKNGE